MLNLPNFLTLFRILTIPFFLIYLSYHRYGEALIIFIIGGVTDFLDGLIGALNEPTDRLRSLIWILSRINFW
jgi:phosphatidylserine synthase